MSRFYGLSEPVALLVMQRRLTILQIRVKNLEKRLDDLSVRTLKGEKTYDMPQLD